LATPISSCALTPNRHNELVVSEPAWEGSGVAVTLSFGDTAQTVHYSSPAFVPGAADFTLPLSLTAAMRIARALRLPRPVSPRLLGSAALIQEVFATWTADLEPVELVVAPSAPPPPPPGRGVAAFFSGGVDSFHTLLRNVDEITHLIFVRGFDFHRRVPAIRAPATETARRVARELGKELVEVDTDVHDFTNPIFQWEYYMVAAMATVAHLLGDAVERVFIPAEHTYADLVPWGSHPLVDPLWSTESVELVHDGAASRRTEKVAYLARSELAMDVLRVCWRNTGGAYNCGRCEKCLRTMIALHAAGALERCATLPSSIDVEEVAAMELSNASDLGFARENRSALERLGNAEELVEALLGAERRWLRASEGRPPGP
jgi:7-cyano-7-deazaguanine synthase in queuosine biosynthesis